MSKKSFPWNLHTLSRLFTIPAFPFWQRTGSQRKSSVVLSLNSVISAACSLHTSPQAHRLGWQPKWRNIRPQCHAGAYNKTHAAVRAGQNNPNYVCFPSTQCWFLHCWSHFERQKLTQKWMFLMALPGHAEGRNKICFLCCFIWRRLFMMTCLWYVRKMHICSQNRSYEKNQRALAQDEHLFSVWKTAAPSDLTVLNIVFIPQW